MFFIYRLKKVRNDVYAEIEASKKDCLFQDLTYTLWLSELRNIDLKVSIEAIFDKKNFDLSARELHDECSASISVEIVYF